VTGYGLPAGIAGVRRAVDLVVPDGALAVIWRLAVLAAVLLGLRAGRGRSALVPWLLFAASKVVVTALFFGYARQGATVIPVVALLTGLAAERWLFHRLGRRRRALGLGLLVLAVGLEAGRWSSPPALSIDGRPVGSRDPFPVDLHVDQRLAVGGPALR
jgi:hypothetical protein